MTRSGKTAATRAPRSRGSTAAGERPSARPAAPRAAGRAASRATDGRAAVRAYLRSLPPWQRRLAQRVDALLAREVPDVRRAIKWGMPFYGRTGRGWFVSCGGFKDHVKVTFFHGASLEPLPPSGKGRLRGVELRDARDVDRAPLASWARQAAKLPGFGAGSGP